MFASTSKLSSSLCRSLLFKKIVARDLHIIQKRRWLCPCWQPHSVNDLLSVKKELVSQGLITIKQPSTNIHMHRLQARPKALYLFSMRSCVASNPPLMWSLRQSATVWKTSTLLPSDCYNALWRTRMSTHYRCRTSSMVAGNAARATWLGGMCWILSSVTCHIML